MNIEEIRQMVANKQNWRLRLAAVELLAAINSPEAKDMIANLAVNDYVLKVREAAYIVAQTLGITKNEQPIYLRKNLKCDLIKFINKKLLKVRNSLPAEFTFVDYKTQFKVLYPEEYDVYEGNKAEHFDAWLAMLIPNLPKK